MGSYNQILGSASWIRNTAFKLSVNKLGFWNAIKCHILKTPLQVFTCTHFWYWVFCVMIKSEIRSSQVRALKRCSMRITMQETIWWNQRWNCNSGGGVEWGMEMVEVVMIVQWVPGLQADVSSQHLQRNCAILFHVAWWVGMSYKVSVEWYLVCWFSFPIPACHRHLQLRPSNQYQYQIIHLYCIFCPSNTFGPVSIKL